MAINGIAHDLESKEAVRYLWVTPQAPLCLLDKVVNNECVHVPVALFSFLSIYETSLDIGPTDRGPHVATIDLQFSICE